MEVCEKLDGRVLRLFDYIEGHSIDILKENPQLLRKLFKQLGETVKQLHQIHLEYFSSRIDSSEAYFKTWSEYLEYRISQIHERALQSNKFDLNQLNTLWSNIIKESKTLNPYIYPTFTHRDIHLDNILVSKAGDLIALIDFDGAESWDPVADFYKLKWFVFRDYAKYEQDFYDGYGQPEQIFKHYKRRLRIIEVIELINNIAQSDDIEDQLFILNQVLGETEWKNPMK